MGGLIAFIATAVSTLAGGSVIAATAIFYGVSAGLYAGLAIGAGLLQEALTPKPSAPKPSDIQVNIKQEVSARRRIYGRFLTGSIIVFGFRRGQKTYVLHYIGEGPIKQFVSFQLDNKPVTLDEDGYVTEDQYQNKGRSRVQILTKLGTMDDGPFAALMTAFPELDSATHPFRQRGCAMVLQICEQVKAQDMGKVYPNNLPKMTTVVDGMTEIYNPNTDDTGFTDNAGLCLLAEAMDVYGLSSTDTDRIDFDAWGDFADHCADNISLKAGGTEKRYRSCGVIEMNRANEDRLAPLMAVCNADVFLDRQGRLSVRQKMSSTPGIALRAKNGDHLDIQLAGGRTEQKKFNRVDAVYVDPSLNWKQNQVVWRQSDYLDDDGAELSQPLDLTLCPSPTQAQRLAKLFLYLNNPEFVGQLSSGPQALDLIEDYCFTLDLNPEQDFERVACATDSIEFDVQQGIVSCPIAIFASGATDWTAATDEQDQAVIPPSLPSNVDDVTLDVTVTVELLDNSAPVLKFTWAAAGSATLPDSYSQQIQVSPADADDWHDATVNQEADTAQYGPVADGQAYDWRIRNIANGNQFDWQNSTGPVTVTVDDTAPQALDAFSAGDGTGQFIANFSTENDSHLATVAIYKLASGGTLDRATDLVGRYAVAPGISYALPLTSDAGDFDIYAEPFNISNVAGPLAGPDEATVS
jgi:hypothetical protein